MMLIYIVVFFFVKSRLSSLRSTLHALSPRFTLHASRFTLHAFSSLSPTAAAIFFSFRHPRHEKKKKTVKTKPSKLLLIYFAFFFSLPWVVQEVPLSHSLES